MSTLIFSILPAVTFTALTCGDVKLNYQSNTCCGADPSTAITSGLSTGRTSLGSTLNSAGQTDFLLLGGGTGGLGYAGRVAQSAHNRGKTVTVLEAGRWIHPYLKKVDFTLDGVAFKRMMPINWPAFVDTWLNAYNSNGIDVAASSPKPRNLFFNPYGWVDFANKLTIVTLLRQLLLSLQSSSQMLLEDIPDIEINLTSSSPFTGDGPTNVLFKGNPIALLDDVHSDIRLNQFIAGYGNSEDLFFYDAYYTNGPDGKMQNYPRGKTIGGSSIANAQVHFGMTRQYLEKMANLTKDPIWSSASAVNMVTGSNTITCSDACAGGDTTNPACRGPVFGMCMPKAPFEPGNDASGSGYNQYLHDLQSRVGRTMDSTAIMSDFDLEKRVKSTITTRSENPYSKTRSSSADAIANLMGLGVSVCFYPHPNPLILSAKVLPDSLNCDVTPSATLKIRTGVLVTKLLFDTAADGSSRATGAEWVYEEEQTRPDQNRFYNNVARNCSATESLYKNGIDNTSDCMNRGYQYEMMVDESFQPLSAEQWNKVRARASTATGVITSLGTKNMLEGQYAPYQRKMPQDSLTLDPLTNVHSVTSKYEVALGMGAPGTTALLMRSGISTGAESRRLKTTLRAELPTGKMSNNYEYFFQPMIKNMSAVKAGAFALENLIGTDVGSLDAFTRSYLRRSNLDESTGYFPLKEANFHLRNYPRMCSNGRYEINDHHFRTFYSTLSSTIYTHRSAESVSTLKMAPLDLPMAAPGFMPELTGSDDARENTAEMKLRDTHPLSKITWMQHNSLSPERCECWFEAVHAAMTQMDVSFPDMGFENIYYTKRRKSLNEFLTEWDEAVIFGGTLPHGTGSATVTQAQLNQYFDNVNNPIISGYKGAKCSDTGGVQPCTDLKDFCSMSMMVNSGHHIQGGANMGHAMDDASVTDPRGKVYNVRNLRVVDISALPISPDGNPWVSVWQLGNLMGMFAGMEHDVLNAAEMTTNADPKVAPHPYAQMWT